MNTHIVSCMRRPVVGRHLPAVGDPFGDETLIRRSALLGAMGTQVVVPLVETDDGSARGLVETVAGDGGTL